MIDTRELCGELHAQKVFTGYAFGDPLPCYAEYVTDEDGSDIEVYIPCQREAGHTGIHLNTTNRGWA